MRYEVVISEAAGQYHSRSTLLDPSTDNAVDLTAFVSCYNESEFIVQTLDDVCSAQNWSPTTEQRVY